MKPIETTVWDTAEYLETEEGVQAYLIDKETIILSGFM